MSHKKRRYSPKSIVIREPASVIEDVVFSRNISKNREYTWNNSNIWNLLGRDLPLFVNLRGIYEPYNYTRKIVCFDTFIGFQHLDEKDGKDGRMETLKRAKDTRNT